MSRRPTRSDVTRAIVRWLQARARAGAMRSVSAALAQAAEYGCPIHSRPAAPSSPAAGLVDAERPLALLTPEERGLLLERYWRDFRQVEVTREIAPGVFVEYRKACFQDTWVVAARLGLAEDELRERLTAVRAKVADGIARVREEANAAPLPTGPTCATPEKTG